jgi:uncharacterized protein (DUF736 family)
MKENKMNENSNIKAQPEVGALWEKDNNNLRFFGRLDVEEVSKLVDKARKNNSDKINIIGYVVNKGEGSKAPDFRLVESKFNDGQVVSRKYED